jgi:hypothetical protein
MFHHLRTAIFMCVVRELMDRARLRRNILEITPALEQVSRHHFECTIGSGFGPARKLYLPYSVPQCTRANVHSLLEATGVKDVRWFDGGIPAVGVRSVLHYGVANDCIVVFSRDAVIERLLQLHGGVLTDVLSNQPLAAAQIDTAPERSRLLIREHGSEPYESVELPSDVVALYLSNALMGFPQEIDQPEYIDAVERERLRGYQLSTQFSGGRARLVRAHTSPIESVA